MAMDQPMFGVLGSLEVRLAEDSVRLGGPKPRMLLATLLLNPGQVVGTDVLTEVLWPDRRPRSAAANLRTYVSTLRKQLAAGPARIHALGTGYMIELPPDELDLLLFEERVAAAEASQHRPAESAALLEQALAVWRGTPLADLPASPMWDSRLRQITQVRLGTAEKLVALRMAAGEYAAAISQLRGLVDEHPFREDLWRQLMVALYRSGRQSEALHAFTVIREQLVTELGIEPGPELSRVHAAILAGDPPSGLHSDHHSDLDRDLSQPQAPPRPKPCSTARSSPGRRLAGSLLTCRISPAARRRWRP